MIYDQEQCENDGSKPFLFCHMATLQYHSQCFKLSYDGVLKYKCVFKLFLTYRPYSCGFGFHFIMLFWFPHLCKFTANHPAHLCHSHIYVYASPVLILHQQGSESQTFPIEGNWRLWQMLSHQWGADSHVLGELQNHRIIESQDWKGPTRSSSPTTQEDTVHSSQPL